jgi:leader peptidase (prepilin peptidase) / N-methyltransferase
MIYLFSFIIGSFVGSFLNCLIYRIEVGDSFVKGRSYCPNCKKNIEPKDLIPIVSFFILKGRCRNCSEKISFRYPLIEVITGIVFVFIIYSQRDYLLTFNGLIEAIFLLIIFSLMIVITVYDFKHFIIPDGATISIIGATLAWHLFLVLNKTVFLSNILPFIFSGLAVSGFFLLIFIISKGNWIGFGDVKLAIFIGLFLGFPNVLVGLFLSFTLGAILGIGLILVRKKKLGSEIPFAPFLILGTSLAFFWGENILNWYLNLI